MDNADKYKFNKRKNGKDKLKNTINKYGKNTSRGERIKLNKIKINISKNK